MTKALNFTFTFLFGISVVFAQDCDGYFAFKKGIKMELTSYDKKDNVAAIIKYEVIDSKSISGGNVIVFKNETFDAKGKLLASADLTGKCADGNFYTEARNFGSETLPKSVDMEVVISGDQLIYPNTLKEGQTLPNASVSIKSGMKGGMTLMTINANLADRKVASFETIETPAGKFECAKITYKLNVKLFGNRTIDCTEYLAKGIGVVKSEQYDEKGRKQSSMILSKLEK